MSKSVLASVQSPKTAAAALIAGAAFSLSPYGSSASALLLGVCIAVLIGNPFADHTKLYAQTLLSGSIIGLGAGMNLYTVGKAGLSGLGMTALTLSATFALGILIGKMVKSDRETSILISIGTAICGSSAITAIGPIIRAKPQSMSVALGTVFLLNAVALILFPAIGHWFNLTQQQFGLWSALAIHDTSSVIGAGLQYGPEALQIGTTVKLARALWIVPLGIGFSLFYRNKAGQSTVRAGKPWFILGFLLMAALVTAIPALQQTGHIIEGVARRALVLTLFMIGANITLATLKSVGIRPFLQGLGVWLLVAASTLALIKTGVF